MAGWISGDGAVGTITYGGETFARVPPYTPVVRGIVRLSRDALVITPAIVTDHGSRIPTVSERNQNDMPGFFRSRVRFSRDGVGSSAVSPLRYHAKL